ncbi:MAG TPA: hypothetical protein PK295_02580, partial [Candidatus Magasanikbacteria bacterium]|nr:hypothetical protein [Candidatus Magasanikbacteria bacterium]
MSLAILTIGSFCVWIADTRSIYNGMDAADTLGQFSEDEFDNLTPLFTRGGPNNGPSNLGFERPNDVTIDPVNHRLFVADLLNNRVLIYNLDSNNELLDYEADYVLGQSDFNGSAEANTQSGMYSPTSVEYDPINSRLYVAQSGNHRVTVYDFSTTTISNGKPALYVLGQTTFTGSSSANTQSGMNTPTGLSYDPINSRLYVAQSGNHRVTVYDFSTTTISNGKPALYVLGQTTFTGGSNATTQSGMWSPYGLGYDTRTNRLFVSQEGNHRVTVYDMVTTTNGENAVNVLGQTSFTNSTPTTTQSGLIAPHGMLYDISTNNLFVGDYQNNRVLVFDGATSSLSNGMNSSDLLGQFVEDGSGNLTPTSTRRGRNNGPTNVGFDTNYDVELDDTNHRLFVADTSNNRVLIYNLDSNNELLDYEADYVLGQPHFGANAANTTQSGMNSPRSLAYSSSTNRLYVAQSGNHRVTVYDVASITNGEDAINVLGQANFTSLTSFNTQSGMNTPTGLAIRYNTTTPLLYVAQSGNHRVTVYDVASIIDGEDAINVLGQTNFSNTFQANSQAGMSSPSGLVYDQGLNRLFVAQSGNHRVTVYDVATTTNGEGAIFVLGQSSFTGATITTTQSAMISPAGLAYDPGNNYLYVAEFGNNRVTKFDLTTLPDVPTAPSVVSFTRQSTSLTVTWGAVSGHTILYTVSSTATSTLITTSSLSIVFSNLIPSTTYSFQ